MSLTHNLHDHTGLPGQARRQRLTAHTPTTVLAWVRLSTLRRPVRRGTVTSTLELVEIPYTI